MTLEELPLAPVSTRPDEATDGYVVALDAAGVPTGLGRAAPPGSPAPGAGGAGVGACTPPCSCPPASACTSC